MEKIRGASVYGKYLEEHLNYSDYVGEKERITGEWFGELAAEFGLAGACQGAKDKGFQNLCDGLHPVTGEVLTQNKREDGVRFFDFQCSAQKSVSLLAVTMRDSRLIEAHEESVKLALEELEKFAAYRSGTTADQRTPEITGNVVGARFTHLSARPDAGGGPADPQLHTHCAIANVSRASNGKHYALTEIEMLRAIRYAGKVYQNEMATRSEGLGYVLNYSHGPNGVIEAYEISGVPGEVLERFSKRSKAVEAAVAQFKAANSGREPTTAELRVIKRETRGEKAYELSQDALVDLQKNQLTPSEHAKLTEIVAAAQEHAASTEGSTTTKKDAVPARVAIGDAISHLYERASVLPRHAILAEALSQNLGRVVLKELHDVVHSHTELVPLTEEKEVLAVKAATASGLKDELRAIRFAREGKGHSEAFVASEKYRAFGGRDDLELNGAKANVSEQRRTADAILQSRDKYVSLRGVAGAGKTTVLTEIDAGLRAGGWRPLHLAPMAPARDVLKEQGFLNASTVAQFLLEQKNPDLQLPKRSVLLVDESGLASNKLGLELMRVVEKADARVIFVGDVKQHTAVEAGDFLRILEENAPIQQFTLDTIQRQKLESYRAAMQAAAAGNSRAAVEQLDALGWVKEGRENYLANAACELTALRRQNGANTVLGVAPTHEEGRAMTASVRKDLTEQGELGIEVKRSVFDNFDWTAQQRRNIDNYRIGQHLSVSTGKIGPLAQNAIARTIGVNVNERTITVEVETGGQFELRINRNTVENLQVGERRELPIAPGETLLITANSKKARLTNGNLVVVKQVHKDGRIETMNGRTIPADFVHLSHGYVITSHKSQGKTVDHVVVAADKLSPREAYVALSRGRKSASLHTAERKNLFEKLPSTNRGRLAATDLRPAPLLRATSEPPKTKRKQFWARLIERANKAAKRTERTIRKASAYAQRFRINKDTYGHRNDVT